MPPPIACETSRGWSSYLPIPYARHCKVTCDGGSIYYHINYRTYKAGTSVKTFDAGELEMSASEIYATAARLTWPCPRMDKVVTMMNARKLEMPIQPGGRITLDLKGPDAIRALASRVEAPDMAAALRSIVLKISFDDDQTVDVPLGDFFGAAPGVNPYVSLPMEVESDGTMWSHWLMPFEKKATIELHNTGAQEALVNLRIAVSASGSPWTPRSMHFHASWESDHDVPTRPMRDWNILQATGRGVYCGTAMAVANPVKAWWGEGDEKIYVDGESFPSHFGTGTEDYFGYAWCCPIPFTHAYHAEPRCDGPGNYGHTAVNRWHILDRIPFEKSLRFDMELWHWAEKTNFTVSAVTYWYGRPGAKSGAPPIDDARLKLVMIPPYKPAHVDGAIEGESMRVVSKTGTPSPQDIDGCSGDQHLWWQGAKPGDRLVLAFDAPKSDRYLIFARLIKAADYGIAALSINGKAAGEPIDCFRKGIVVEPEIPLGTFELTAGENQFAVQIDGSNPRAVPGYMFGLDYLRIVPASNLDARPPPRDGMKP